MTSLVLLIYVTIVTILIRMLVSMLSVYKIKVSTVPIPTLVLATAKEYIFEDLALYIDSIGLSDNRGKDLEYIDNYRTRREHL